MVFNNNLIKVNVRNEHYRYQSEKTLNIMKYDEYQPRGGSAECYYDEVAQRTHFTQPPPFFIEAIGLARTGSTASLNIMASSNVITENGATVPIKAAYQHFKAGYRQAMHGWPNGDWKFQFPERDQVPVFYGKDPLGPYTDMESRFDPLEILGRIQYPIDNTFLTFLLREPSEVLISWKRNWAIVRDPTILRDNLITSFHSVQEIYDKAIKAGYGTSVRVYEDLRDNLPEHVVGNLFDRINEKLTPTTHQKLVMTEKTVSGWDTTVIGSIWHPNEPAIYNREEIKGLHRDAKGGKNGLSYKSYTNEERCKYLTQEDMIELDKNGVYGVYNYFADIERAQGLKINSTYT